MSNRFRTLAFPTFALCAGLVAVSACGTASAPGSAPQETGTGTTGGATTPTTTSTDPSTPPMTTTPQGAGTLVVNATGFVPHAGDNFEAMVLDTNNNHVGNANIVVPADGNFTLNITGLSADGNYHLAYYADLNKNGFCNTPPTDHSWSVPIPAGATSLDIAHNTDFTAVCDAFGNYNLTFTGTGFTPHIGQTFYIDVVDQKDNTEVGAIEQMVIPQSGDTSGSWPGLLLAGHTYTVAYFADVNKNSECDNGGTDHAWVKTVANVSANVALAGAHNDTQTKTVCSNFPTGVLP